jgi:mono/diheme cytochrome c family protein
MKSSILLSVPLLFATLMPAQQMPAAGSPSKSSFYAVPLTWAQKPNPVASTPESLARGQKKYGYDCVMCHGKDGDGRGQVAAEMKLKMRDQTNPATLQNLTDGALFYIIKYGKEQMPPEGDRVSTEELWDMVNYVRSFARGKAPGAEQAAK